MIETKSSFKHWQAAILLLISALALFWPYLSPSGQLILSKMHEDMAGQFVWWRQFGFAELKKGHLALWNPYIYSGEPFFGGFQSALLYPPNWFFMFLPLAFALNSSIAFHVFLAGFFTYLWIRFRGAHPASALMGAFMFMFGASFFLHVVPGHLPNLCSMAWIPLVFLAVDLCYEKKEWRWVLLGMFALAMQIFAGHIQYVYYMGITLSFYVLFLLSQKSGSRFSFFSRLIVMGLGAAALTAVQLLAGWEAGAESARAHSLDIDFVDIGDISPERLWCLLMPDFFGNWRNYWGGGFYWEGPVFVSLTALVMVLTALWISTRPAKKFFAFLALGLVLVGVGKRLPFFALAYKYFPLFGSFRGIGKFNIFITLCLVVLAAMGMDEVLKSSEVRQKLKTGVWRAGVVFFLVAVIFWMIPLLGGARVFKNYAQYSASMALSIFLCALLFGLIGLVAHRSIKNPRWRYGFVFLSFGELFLFASGNLPSFQYGDLIKKISMIQDVYQKNPGDYRIHTGDSDYALGYGLWCAGGDDPALPGRYNEYGIRARNLISSTRDNPNPLSDYSNALSLCRLKYWLYEKDGKLVVQKLDLPRLPRAFIVGQWEKKPLDQIWSEIFSPSFQPLKKAWVEQNFRMGPSSGLKIQGGVTVTDLSTDAIEIEAKTNEPAILVITDNYSVGWKAKDLRPRTDGQKVEPYEIIPANGFMRAIPLEAGSHHILLQYRPTAFVIGAWISGISWVLFLGFFFLTVLLSCRPKGL